MFLKRSIFLYTLLITGLFFINSINHKTFVPIELQEIRNFVPSNDLVKKKYSKFYDFHRDADNYFYHSKRVTESFKYNNEGSTYFSLDTMLGYPIGPEIENASGLGDYFTNILLKCCIEDSYQASLVSSDLTLVVWTIISFIILIYIGKALNFKNEICITLAIICNPAFFSYSYEGTLMSVIGSQIIFLGCIGLMRENKFLYYFLSFLGSALIFNSNDYHFFLYLPLTILIFLPYLWSVFSKKTFVFFLTAIAIPFFLSVEKFLWINDLLSNSLQKTDLETSLISRSYHPLLISGFIDLPLIQMFANQIAISSISSMISFFFPTTVILIGYVVGIMGLVSIYEIKNKKIYIPIILLLLYWMGPFHYILGTLSDTFQAETSIRINHLLYMIFAILALNSINNNIAIKYKKLFTITSTFIVIASILQFLIITVYDFYRGLDVIWFAALIPILSVILFLKFLKTNNKKYVLSSILVVAMSNAFFFNGVRTFQAHDYTKLIELNTEINNQFDDTDVALLISREDSSSSIHPNAFMQNKLRVIQSYLTPNPENFSKLYWQQYFSYNEDDKSKTNKKIIDEVKYLDMTGPTVIKGNNLTLETENFIHISAVTKIITTEEVFLDTSKYMETFSNYGIKIFEPIKKNDWIYSSCIIYGLEKYSDLLKKEDLKSDKTIYVEGSLTKKECKYEPKISKANINKKMSRIEFTVSGNGIVFLNVSFNNNLYAKIINPNSASDNDIEVFRCNVAFTCMRIPEIDKSKNISLFYQKPTLRQYLKSNVKT